MWQNDFYPTPASIGEKFTEILPDDIYNNNAMILEPSAGKGDLLEAFIKSFKERFSCKKYGYYGNILQNETNNLIKERIHVIEIEPELQGILRDKGFNLVESDFFQYHPDIKYTHIIMNPPFSCAQDHLLHAWEIVDDGGYVICILPENYLDSHQKLADIVYAHGSVHYLGSFNCDDAFRKASVEVSAFIIKKPERKQKEFDFDGLYDKDVERIFQAGDEKSEIAVRDTIGNYVYVYEKLIDTFCELSDKMSEFSRYLKYFNVDINHTDNPYMKHLVDISRCSFSKSDNDYRSEYNSFIKTLKNTAWSQIFKMTNAENLMTTKVRKDFEKFRIEQSNLAFSAFNIQAFLRNLYFSQKDIKTQCVVEAFDKMTSFDKKNKIHIEGWKTNSFYKVNKKVIMPYGLSTWKFDLDRPHLNWSYRDVLDDIDKAMCFLTGKKFSDVKTISQTIEEAKFFNEDYMSTFFKIRCYKKGTIHFTFLDMDLLALFNRVAVKDKWNLVGYEDQ